MHLLCKYCIVTTWVEQQCKWKDSYSWWVHKSMRWDLTTPRCLLHHNSTLDVLVSHSPSHLYHWQDILIFPAFHCLNDWSSTNRTLCLIPEEYCKTMSFTIPSTLQNSIFEVKKSVLLPNQPRHTHMHVWTYTQRIGGKVHIQDTTRITWATVIKGCYICWMVISSTN